MKWVGFVLGIIVGMAVGIFLGFALSALIIWSACVHSSSFTRTTVQISVFYDGRHPYPPFRWVFVFRV